MSNKHILFSLLHVCAHYLHSKILIINLSINSLIQSHKDWFIFIEKRQNNSTWLEHFYKLLLISLGHYFKSKIYRRWCKSFRCCSRSPGRLLVYSILQDKFFNVNYKWNTCTYEYYLIEMYLQVAYSKLPMMVEQNKYKLLK